MSLFEETLMLKLIYLIIATKSDLKDATGIDTSNFAVKSNLASLKTEVDKLDIEKLAPVPVDLSKLIDKVKNDVAKKTAYEKSVTQKKH